MQKFDYHIVFTLLQRGWTILAGGITLLVVPRFLTATEQGYYYTFASFVGMQVFFDLGFNAVIVQIVGHESAGASVDGRGRPTDGKRHNPRLAYLVRLLRRWYRFAATAFFVCIAPFGFFFFSAKGGLTIGDWIVPWLLQILFTSISLYFSPFLAVVEGQGSVGEVARLRLVQSILGYLLFWSLLAAGLGLKASPALPAVAAAMTLYWLKFRRTLPSTDTAAHVAPSGNTLSWRRDIFPFQWRIALSWISGYFIFSLFTPMLFAHQGAVEAGRIGLTLTIFTSIVALGMSWVSAKVPNFSMLVARRERSQLNALFWSVLSKSLACTALICLVVVGGICALRAAGIEQMQRVASLPVLLTLCVVTLANVVIFSAAAYMRAHKEEPMLFASIGSGVLVLLSVYFLSRVSVISTMLGYAAIVLFVSLPWTLKLFSNYYRRT